MYPCRKHIYIMFTKKVQNGLYYTAHWVGRDRIYLEITKEFWFLIWSPFLRSLSEVVLQREIKWGNFLLCCPQMPQSDKSCFDLSFCILHFYPFVWSTTLFTLLLSLAHHSRIICHLWIHANSDYKQYCWVLTQSIELISKHS